MIAMAEIADCFLRNLNRKDALHSVLHLNQPLFNQVRQLNFPLNDSRIIFPDKAYDLLPRHLDLFLSNLESDYIHVRVLYQRLRFQYSIF